MKAISRARAQEIANYWHGGQWSALYQFTSSGVFMPENSERYLSELWDCLQPEFALHPGELSQKNEKELKSLFRWFAFKCTEIGIKTETKKHELYGYNYESVTDANGYKITPVRQLT